MKLCPLLLLISSNFVTAASVTIGAGSFSNFLNDSGQLLTTGSKVQVGFFRGINVTKDGGGLQSNGPATFSQTQWDTFTPFDETLFETFDADGASGNEFDSVFSASYTVETDSVVGLTFPAYVGFRIFDTISDDLTGAMFNTVARTVSTWEFTDPSVVTNQPPSPSIPKDGSVTPGTIFWEDNTSPFETSITPVPEPSTGITALLGAALLLGSRRRK